MAEIADNEMLGIDSVISEDVALSKYVLYATPINEEETTGILNQLIAATTENQAITNTVGMINEIESTLSKTNSSQFYKGDIAQKNIGIMNEVGTDLNDILTSIGEFDISEIKRLVADYNSHLNNIKKNARRELLEKTAEDFNKENLEWEGYPKNKTYTNVDGMSINGGPRNPLEDSELNPKNDNEEFEVDGPISSTSNTKDFKDDMGNIITQQTTYTNTYKIHKYKRIKCNFGLKHIQTWLDPTFEDIERQFEYVGCELPYDKEHPAIKNDGTKNNSLGWNS